MTNKIVMNLDKAIYNEGEYIKLKVDYEALNPKQTMHIEILDPSEKEIFSIDQYTNSQKGTSYTMLRFDTKQWRTSGRYKIAAWDKEGSRKEAFFQFKTKHQ